MNATTNIPGTSSAPALNIDLSKLPALLDAYGVERYIADLGRSLLYTLASKNEIESVSLGMGRGKRMFVTASVVAWINRRALVTTKPAMGLNGHKTKATAPATPELATAK